LRVLLDTHAFLWWLVGDPRLTKKPRSLLADPSRDVFVSAASAWEISTKVALGKLPHFAALSGRILEIARGEGFKPLSISIMHSDHAGRLPRHHRDPFDRMLIAQAHLESMAILSNDEVFDRYGVARLW